MSVAAVAAPPGVGKVVLTMLRGRRRAGVSGYRLRPGPGNAPHRRQGGRRLVTVDGKTLKLVRILHLTGATNITAAPRHHAQPPHRPLQTLKTR